VAPAEKRDPIARMLEGGEDTDAKQPTRATVLLAQRALQKIGYVIRPDGMMGATTRQALELFERERRLPVDGELSARVRRELSSAAGFAVE
jgi:peptidoglycan hydrolase-like protein with peptidoglycan-binding domain